MKIAQERISVRFNYKHLRQDSTFQVVFELRNYTPQPFRVNALDPERCIIRLRKDQLGKGVVKDFKINTYLQNTANKIRLAIDFLKFFNLPINKQNIEKYVYWQFSAVYQFFETGGDEDLIRGCEIDDKSGFESITGFIENHFIKTAADHEKDEKESIARRINLGIYNPTGVKETIELKNYENIQKHKLLPFLNAYCESKKWNDIPVSTFTASLFDDIITFLCRYPVSKGRSKKGGEGKFYSIQTIKGFIKHIHILFKNLQEDGYAVDKAVFEIHLRVGNRSNSHVSYSYSETENVIAITKTELDAIKAAKYIIKPSKGELDILEKTRKLFLLQTLSGGLRLGELKLITKDSFYILNDKPYLNIPSPKANKTIDNPLNTELQKLLKEIDYDVQSLIYFNSDSIYGKNLKKLAWQLGFDRDVPVKSSKVNQTYAITAPKKLFEVFCSKFARKGFTTLLFYMGYTIEQISVMTGHSSDSIRNYIAVLLNEKEEMAEAL